MPADNNTPHAPAAADPPTSITPDTLRVSIADLGRRIDELAADLAQAQLDIGGLDSRVDSIEHDGRQER